MQKRILVIISDDEFDFMNIRTELIKLLYVNDIRFAEVEENIELKNILIVFKIKNEPIKYEEYDSIPSRDLKENLPSFVENLKEN